MKIYIPPPETDEVLDQLFEGVLIPCNDPEAKHFVPGWKCKKCGWTVGTIFGPPGHFCETEDEVAA